MTWEADKVSAACAIPKAQTFHEPWKSASTRSTRSRSLGIFNMDEYRHAIDEWSRVIISASYYERR